MLHGLGTQHKFLNFLDAMTIVCNANMIYAGSVARFDGLSKPRLKVFTYMNRCGLF